MTVKSLTHTQSWYWAGIIWWIDMKIMSRFTMHWLAQCYSVIAGEIWMLIHLRFTRGNQWGECLSCLLSVCSVILLSFNNSRFYAYVFFSFCAKQQWLMSVGLSDDKSLFSCSVWRWDSHVHTHTLRGGYGVVSSSAQWPWRSVRLQWESVPSVSLSTESFFDVS